MRYLLSVDIGTTAIKAVVLGENGKLYGHQTIEYALITQSNGAVEQDLKVYEHAFADAIAGAIDDADVRPAEICTLGLSATGETVVFLDADGKPLRRVMAWMDTRSIEEAQYLTALFSREELLRRTGAPAIRPSFLASKILWVRRNEPAIFERVQTVLLIKDYFLKKLYGEYISEDSLMCDAGYWDISTRSYWHEMLMCLGIDQDQLPKVVLPGTELGQITLAAAEEYGLPLTTKINAGSMDQACGAIGAGNIRPGIVSESTGSALVAVTISDVYQYDPTGRIPVFCAGIPGQFMFQPFSTGAIIMKWYRDQFCSRESEIAAASGQSAYALIDTLAASVPAGCEGLILLPYFQGSGSPEVNKKAKGVYYGITSAHTRAHFARAIMEGLAMALYRMVQATEPLCSQVKEIRSLGGGAKSGLWCQIKADILGVPVKTITHSESAACVGAAILAGVAAGLWDSVPCAVDQMVSFSQLYVPNSHNAAVYEACYSKYVEISELLNKTFT